MPTLTTVGLALGVVVGAPAAAATLVAAPPAAGALLPGASAFCPPALALAAGAAAAAADVVGLVLPLPAVATQLQTAWAALATCRAWAPQAVTTQVCAADWMAAALAALQVQAKSVAPQPTVPAASAMHLVCGEECQRWERRMGWWRGGEREEGDGEWGMMGLG